MNTLALKLIGLAVALSIAFGAGFYTAHQFAKADQVSAANETVKEATTSIAESGKQSQVIEAVVQKTEEKSKQIAKEAVRHVTETEKTNEKKCDRASLHLDVGTVRLLNLSRENNPEPSAIGDAEGKTPSTIGFPELVGDELEITQLYKELAIRHNALVDYLQEQIEKQAAKKQ